ncbi:type 4a pilus biogenesis protein PilO [Thiotrichales bacterium 19X7-9]|nr:type 4a pilus biogenesis protein PilO [Thiotrichales bacterium 19X7-9]
MLDRLTQFSIRLDKIITLPRYARLVIYFIVFILCVGIGYWFFISNLIDKLNLKAQQEVVYKEKITHKLVILAKAQKYTAQIDQLQNQFEIMLKQLPNDNEIPSLIEEMTDNAFSAGLEFHLIKPLEIKERAFYRELPIEVVVEGTYNQIGRFVGSIASMPRLITIKDFTLKRSINSRRLILSLNTITYQYVSNNKSIKKETDDD